MAPLCAPEASELSVDEIISEIKSVPWVIQFEYTPKNSFLHATVERDTIQPYELVRKIEALDISANGLFIFFPESVQARYTQHLRYNARMKAFVHSNGDEVDNAKNQ
jgi:hypothetical protein